MICSLKKTEKESEKWDLNRIRVLDSTVAAATFGFPKANCVIIASCCKYHRGLGHF